MKLLAYILSIFTLFLLASCQQSPMEMSAMAEADASSPELKATKQDVVKRKLIKEGSVTFETDNPSATRQHIVKSVEKYQGYIASDETYKSSDIVNYRLTVRVPAKHFDQLLADATKGAESLDSKSVQVKDVTEEFLDVQVRLKTKKALEKRYLELLEQAKAVTEILEVEKQLGQLRSDIESVEGRLNYLQNQVSFSTLTITFYEEDAKQSYSVRQLKEGFYNGWNNLISFFIFVINIWPFVIIGIGLVFGFRTWRKRRRAAMQ